MMNPSTVHVAAASLDQTVGDWSGNRDRLLGAIAEAKARGATLVLTPELAISGYSLGDRVFMPGTTERSWRVLTELAPATQGLILLVGLPVRHRDVLYDVVAVVADGAIQGLVPKENLATGDVQYETRWYAGWQRGRVETFTTPDGAAIPIGSLLFEAHGIGAFGVEVCEDGWKGSRPGSMLALAGATLVCNASASWFMLGKHRVRRDMVRQISREDKALYLYASLGGCDATRLIFDGTLIAASEGKVLGEGRRFVIAEPHALLDVVVDLTSLHRDRSEEGSWRQQVEAMQRGELGPVPHRVQLRGSFASPSQAAPPAPYWRQGTEPAPSPDPSLDWLVQAGLLPAFAAHDLPHVELELALCTGMSSYRRKCRIPRFTLALSGGRDSSMCAVLAARAARYEHPSADAASLRQAVHSTLSTAYLATDHSGSATQNAAKALADELGAKHHDTQIQALYQSHLATVQALTGTAMSWETPSHDIPLQNVQARLRGALIWTLANLEGGLLLTTSNLSEVAVGYCTMDGDTAGGLSPIADVPKSLVSEWLTWAADFHALDSLKQVSQTPPTAELRPPGHGQTDEGDLMPFEVLDQLNFHFVQQGLDPWPLFQAVWPAVQHRYAGDAHAFAAHVARFVSLFCRAQWKRDRFAISFRVTAFDLDPQGGFRFPAVQAGFIEEIAELYAHVERNFPKA